MAIVNPIINNNYLDDEYILKYYTGNNILEKFIAMINDINKNYKDTPMTISICQPVIEINKDLIIEGWKNKVIHLNGTLWFNKCNAIIFKQIQFCTIYMNRISSNSTGLISTNVVKNLNNDGIKFFDCSYNNIDINEIIGFNIGIQLYSEYGSLGSMYNKISFNSIWRCKQAIELLCGSTQDNTSYISGWVNENSFFGGMIDSNKGIKIGQNVSTRPKNEPSDQYHDNKFYNIGFEQIRDTEDPVAIDIIQGRSNSFLYPRFEGATSVKGYTLIREGKDALMNVYETANYMMEVNRIQLNTSETRTNGKVCPCNSVVIGDIRENSAIIANKMIALKGGIFYEGTQLWIDVLRPNTLNWEYNNNYIARYKDKNGNIKKIGYI